MCLHMQFICDMRHHCSPCCQGNRRWHASQQVARHDILGTIQQSVIELVYKSITHITLTISHTVTALNWLIVQCFTSPPTQYRLYGRWFLQVKRPNQQYQNTEGDATKEKGNNENTALNVSTIHRNDPLPGRITLNVPPNQGLASLGLAGEYVGSFLFLHEFLVADMFINMLIGWTMN